MLIKSTGVILEWLGLTDFWVHKRQATIAYYQKAFGVLPKLICTLNC